MKKLIVENKSEARTVVTTLPGGMVVETKYAAKPAAPRPLPSLIEDFKSPKPTDAEISARFHINGKAKAPKKAAKPADYGASLNRAQVKVELKPEAKIILAAGFTFVKTANGADGYQHKDGRAVLVGDGGWMLAQPDGSKTASGDVKPAQQLNYLADVLKHKAQIVKTETRVPRETDALMKLGWATTWKFDPASLAGDKSFSVRMKLAKAVHGSLEARAKHATVKALRESFMTMIGMAGQPWNAAAIKQAAAEAAKAKAKATKEEKAFIAKEMARTAVERSVPGDITPPPPLPSRQSAKQQAAANLAVAKELAASGKKDFATSKTYTVTDKKGDKVELRRYDAQWTPSADPGAMSHAGSLYEAATGIKLAQNGVLVTLDESKAKVVSEDAKCLVPTECALLEHVDTGVALLRLAKPGLHGGAPCVYNDGSRVVLGVVSMTTLAKFRVIENADIKSAAKQLLAPVVASVKMTTEAESHLTAVLHSKEIADMETKNTKKFEGPTTAKKTAAKKTAAKKTAAKKTAIKSAKPATERKSSLFRLKGDGKNTWGGFTGQKGDIVAAFKKLGAIGAKAKGVTRAALIAALPDISANNISFYLSKWQPAGLLEKLAAE
jgi:hypothetical protein